MDGKLSLKAIAHQVMTTFPTQFASEVEACTYVSELVIRYNA